MKGEIHMNNGKIKGLWISGLLLGGFGLIKAFLCILKFVNGNTYAILSAGGALTANKEKMQGTPFFLYLIIQMIFAIIALWIGCKTIDKSVESNQNIYYNLGIGLILIGLIILLIEIIANAITIFSILAEIVSILFFISIILDRKKLPNVKE